MQKLSAEAVIIAQWPPLFNTLWLANLFFCLVYQLEKVPAKVGA